MHTQEEIKELSKRISLANKHWGLFLSQMRSRHANLEYLSNSPVIEDKPLYEVTPTAELEV
jgi:hypothetical protein